MKYQANNNNIVEVPEVAEVPEVPEVAEVAEVAEVLEPTQELLAAGLGEDADKNLESVALPTEHTRFKDELSELRERVKPAELDEVMHFLSIKDAEEDSYTTLVKEPDYSTSTTRANNPADKELIDIDADFYDSGQEFEVGFDLDEIFPLLAHSSEVFNDTDEETDLELAVPWRSRGSSPVVKPLSHGVLKGTQEESFLADLGDEAFFYNLQARDDKNLMTGESIAAERLLPLAQAKLDFIDTDSVGVDSEIILGVKLRQYGPIYFFRAGKYKVEAGSSVIIDTENGASLGQVLSVRRLRLPLLETADGTEISIGYIRALADASDIAAAADNQILASSAKMFCKQCVRKNQLDMKLVDVEVLHDRSKIIFYFTAPARIDFRELVKDLAKNYRTRIELRQIGVRHETQMLGALGNCGMVCCCRRYLRNFAPVTIKMAKEQNLFLNPVKLSGICGRLLCCLSYEQSNYEEFHQRSPRLGKKYSTADGAVKILRANLFKQSVTYLNELNEEVEISLDAWDDLKAIRADNLRSNELKTECSQACAVDENTQGEQAQGEQARAEAKKQQQGQAKAQELSESSALSPEVEVEVFNLQVLYTEDLTTLEEPSLEDLNDKEAAANGKKSVFGLPGSRYVKDKNTKN